VNASAASIFFQSLRLPTKWFWKCTYSCWKYGSKPFNSVRYNTNHVLYQLLPPKKTFIHYNLWQQSHSLTLPSEDDNLIRNNFQQRMLFRDILGVCIVLLHFISPLYAFVENFTSYVCVCVSSQNRPTWYKYISWGQELSYNVGSLLSLEAPMLTCICPGWSYHRYWLLLAVNAKVVKGHTLWRMCTTYNVKPAI